MPDTALCANPCHRTTGGERQLPQRFQKWRAGQPGGSAELQTQGVRTTSAGYFAVLYL